MKRNRISTEMKTNSALIEAVQNTAADNEVRHEGKFHRPEPRLFTKSQAAFYCGLTIRGFSAWVKIGRIPGPIAGTTRWDRRAIDAALDDANKETTNENADTYDNWKARYHENQSKGNPYGKKKTR